MSVCNYTLPPHDIWSTCLSIFQEENSFIPTLQHFISLRLALSKSLCFRIQKRDRLIFNEKHEGPY